MVFSLPLHPILVPGYRSRLVAVIVIQFLLVSKNTIAQTLTFLPGWGGGVRIKLNKVSGTNLSIDYAFGVNGSQGLFFNIAEVF